MHTVGERLGRVAARAKVLGRVLLGEVGAGWSGSRCRGTDRGRWGRVAHGLVEGRDQRVHVLNKCYEQ